MQNRIAEQDGNPAPVVGMGATKLMYSDRHAYTVVKVLNAKTIWVQQDNAVRTDNNGMSDCQVYEFTPNLEAPVVVVTLRKNGQWIRMGESLAGTAFALGYRSEYYDPTF